MVGKLNDVTGFLFSFCDNAVARVFPFDMEKNPYALSVIMFFVCFYINGIWYEK